MEIVAGEFRKGKVRAGLDYSLDFEVAGGRVHLAPGVTGWSLALLAEAQLRG